MATKAYLPILRRNEQRQGAYMRLQRELAELVELINAQAPFPAAFNLEEQALFLVGYYHQKAHDIRLRTQTKQETPGNAGSQPQ